MSIEIPKHKPTVAAFLIIFMFSLPLVAQTPAEQPESMSEAALLAALASANEQEASRIDRQLQALWTKSGSPAMDLLLERGRDALENHDVAAAIEHLTALTDHAPEFAEGWHGRASAYFNADLLGPALADLERALVLNPANYNAIYGLGAILEQLGDPQRAFLAYRHAQAIHPHHEDVIEALDRLRPVVQGQDL
ncbi:tetratricopeptide repeat protein [Pontibaca salina]|uniref:Tetratricopeptide repeat protein n=1 Tax=Pontibaca salina TaxID=2795731 RepID=A0A934M0B8_9RHOB|nr:tetratricopeptide repeat protein [Pontibaca salina]MBI6629845.1 hypothetical protein [Pontibaca salina]